MWTQCGQDLDNVDKTWTQLGQLGHHSGQCGHHSGHSGHHSGQSGHHSGH